MQAKTILVIDDSNTSVLLMDFALKHAGYTTQLAYSVKEAVEQMKSKIPDLIILDLSMPEISGYDFLEMKKKMNMEHIPVLVLSAHDHPESIERSKALGASEFASKPVKIDQILLKIKNLID